MAAAAADEADDSADVFPTFDEEVADASPALFRFDGAAMMFSNRSNNGTEYESESRMRSEE